MPRDGEAGCRGEMEDECRLGRIRDVGYVCDMHSVLMMAAGLEKRVLSFNENIHYMVKK